MLRATARSEIGKVKDVNAAVGRRSRGMRTRRPSTQGNFLPRDLLDVTLNDDSLGFSLPVCHLEDDLGLDCVRLCDIRVN